MLLSFSFIYNKSQKTAFSIAYFRSRNFQSGIFTKEGDCVSRSDWVLGSRNGILFYLKINLLADAENWKRSRIALLFRQHVPLDRSVIGSNRILFYLLLRRNVTAKL